MDDSPYTAAILAAPTAPYQWAAYADALRSAGRRFDARLVESLWAGTLIEERHEVVDLVPPSRAYPGRHSSIRIELTAEVLVTDRGFPPLPAGELPTTDLRGRVLPVAALTGDRYGHSCLTVTAAVVTEYFVDLGGATHLRPAAPPHLDGQYPAAVTYPVVVEAVCHGGRPFRLFPGRRRHPMFEATKTASGLT